MNTIGLDVTFDLATAAFFASHSFSLKPNGKATFEPVAANTNVGVIYCFVFRDPPVKKTNALISELRMFEHLLPVRPIRQTCALRTFDVTEIAAASLDLDAVLYLDSDFALAGLPGREYLIPGADDPFYQALLEQKNIGGPVGEVWKEIVEYDFT
jgi:hypothetical protein